MFLFFWVVFVLVFFVLFCFVFSTWQCDLEIHMGIQSVSMFGKRMLYHHHHILSKCFFKDIQLHIVSVPMTQATLCLHLHLLILHFSKQKQTSVITKEKKKKMESLMPEAIFTFFEISYFFMSHTWKLLHYPLYYYRLHSSHCTWVTFAS